ncbi:cAMP-dependent protein kinase catalytic subunit PRKX-like [Amphiura filiformis]|uniref:cAMP-dependent protein kinase catalytic subunit PRKX-like n=1 Tax=Amphiura filiformis TaxID=82378 RepID=UPI003B214661
MAHCKIQKSKNLRRSGSSNKLKEPPAPIPDNNNDRKRQYKLEDFELMSTVGTGTFGRVVLARDKKNKEYMALKILNITDIIKLKQTEHVLNEKAILSATNHPFIVQLAWSHHTDTFLYMVLEYICGGELFTYLRNMGRFNAATARFFASEITSALEHLHKNDIVYRDLKPENVLLDRDGHIKLTDFGFAKKLRDRTWTLCGTPEYLAPEIIQSKGHGKPVDWWALGILIYEMLVGYPPFYDENPFGIYEKILEGKIDWPKHLTADARDMIKRLLVIDRTKRLGCMLNGCKDITGHRWFMSIDWDQVKQRQLKPPIVPEISHDGDTRNFDDYPNDDWQKGTAVSEEQLKVFKDF